MPLWSMKIRDGERGPRWGLSETPGRERHARCGREIAFSLIMSLFTVRETEMKLIPPDLVLVPVLL